jgi:putative ABC transport system ATP-binding protein
VALIQIEGLTKLYRMGEHVVRALDGVDLAIDAGDFVAITGASGSGKSTMMHLLGCLDRPTAGSYVLRGRNVSNMSDGELADIRNKEIGFVFQTFNLINRTTAIDNVAVPLFYARMGNTRGPAMKALERVGLEQRAFHKPSELSGGERQRVAIARAIVTKPAFLLADEPTGNLDSKTGDQIMEIFHSLNSQGVTIVLVTHEPDIAAQARRIVQMKDGKIVADRTRDEWLKEISAGVKPPIAIASRSALPLAALADGPAESLALAAGFIPSAGATAAMPAVSSVRAHSEQTPTSAHTTAESGTSVAQSPHAIAYHRRRAPGASGALINGLIAIGCYVGIMVTTVTLKLMGVPMEKIGPAEIKKFGTILMVSGILNLLLFLGTIVMGILAIRFGCVALWWIRREKDQRYGRLRSWIGLSCGVVAVGLPVVGAIVFVVQMMSKASNPA